MIGFRRLELADLPLLLRWLETPHVQEHYHDDLHTLDDVLAHYGPGIRGEEPTHMYLALLEDVPIGFIQTYLIESYPAYAAQLDVGAGAAAVDMLIGEPTHVHRGLGATILRQFVADVVWPITGATTCWIGPAIDNRIAIRAYEKAGFSHVKTVDVAGEPAPEYLMRIVR